MIYISGIFFFFGIGIFGLLNIRNDDQIMEWGYWHVFSLNIAHADDDEDEEDEWKWNSKQEKNENEKMSINLIQFQNHKCNTDY